MRESDIIRWKSLNPDQRTYLRTFYKVMRQNGKNKKIAKQRLYLVLTHHYRLNLLGGKNDARSVLPHDSSTHLGIDISVSHDRVI